MGKIKAIEKRKIIRIVIENNYVKKEERVAV